MRLWPRVTHLAIAALALVALSIFAVLSLKTTVGEETAGVRFPMTDVASIGESVQLEVVSPGPTKVGGLISTGTTWTLSNSPYIVTSSVLVKQGVTLTIEPGVEVRFHPGLALQVNGELVARGGGDAPVVFTSNSATPTSGDWGFILFADSSIDATYDQDGNYLSGSISEHCTVEFAGGVSGSNYALRIVSSGPFINHCTVKDNAGSGISASGGNVKIVNSTITRNTATQGGGISIAGGTATLFGNTITGNTAENSGGVIIQGGTATLSGNAITGNRASYNRGILLSDKVNATLSDNTITGNTAKTLLASSSTVAPSPFHATPLWGT